MPVSLGDVQNRVSRFDGPRRVAGAGFQASDAKLIGPADLFGDPAYTRARQIANEVTDYVRRHGHFMPHGLGPEEMEHTDLPEVLLKLNNRFIK